MSDYLAGNIYEQILSRMVKLLKDGCGHSEAKQRIMNEYSNWIEHEGINVDHLYCYARAVIHVWGGKKKKVKKKDAENERLWHTLRDVYEILEKERWGGK